MRKTVSSERPAHCLPFTAFRLFLLVFDVDVLGIDDIVI
jgi:hypothetical protein